MVSSDRHTTPPSPGRRFRDALAVERPLQIAGAINAYAALLAQRAGFRALYLSGAGVANASYGLPDLGITSLQDVLDDVRRITAAVPELPILVDIDTGWGHAFTIARTIHEMERAGAAAVHIEDQVAAKRCGHRPGKELVSTSEMCDRIHAAVAARRDPDFVIMARTDAVAGEGMNRAIKRARQYREAGADMLFPEALARVEDYQRFVEETGLPVLANLTEFGKTPLLGREELRQAGVAMTLYPLSAFRAMSRAAERVYTTIRQEGTQEAVVGEMQTRDELYAVLDYHAYEQQIDALLQQGKEGFNDDDRTDPDTP